MGDYKPGIAGNDTIEHALNYANLGFQIFPVMGKQPQIKGWPEQATTEFDQIQNWWGGQFSQAGIGIVTGPKSGIFVLDVDTGEGKHGMAALEDLQAKHGSLPATRLAASGGGGLHYYFRYPDAVEIRNSASKLGAGLDIRGEGGFIVAPPSLHPNGECYSWVQEAPVAQAPEWLIGLISVKRPTTHVSNFAVTRASSLPISDAYFKAAVDGELSTLRAAMPGTRNETLNKVSFKVGTLIEPGHLSEEAIKNELLMEAQALGLGEEEARSTIASGLAAGRNTSRVVHHPAAASAIAQNAASGVSAMQEQVSSALPAVSLNPPASYRVGNFRVDEKGVWYVDPDPDPDKYKPEAWVCSRIDVIAKTRNADGGDWGRLLCYRDGDGKIHEWPMPMALLAGDGTAYREYLLSTGVLIAPGVKAKNLLTEYLQTSEATGRARAVSRIGWHDKTFVLPDATFGESPERVLLQGRQGVENSMQEAGTLKEWQEHVALKCLGSRLLIFSLCVAFAAVLLRLVGEDSGGFHFRGASSTGKTTLLKIAKSVWGFGLQRWRATANGLEGLAEAHCDALLTLDELAQVAPTEAGEIAYMLANGSGKTRATRNGSVRPKATWVLLLLSAGEISLADHMRVAGKQVKAGQEVRLVDIAADAGAGMGVFEALHDEPSADALARCLSSATSRFFGTPIRAFLRELIPTIEALPEAVRAFRTNFEASYVPKGCSGEVSRVAGRFSLVAAAGEMAIDAGILPFPTETAETAVAECFNEWLRGRGGAGYADMENAIMQVRRFIAAHGSSRFTDLDEFDTSKVFNRAGFRRRQDGETEYLILADAFRHEVAAGFDFKQVARELKERGYLVTPQKDRFTDNIRVPELGRPSLYRVKSSIMGES